MALTLGKRTRKESQGRNGHIQLGKQGYFENLNHVIIADFDPSAEAANYVDKDFSEGGILMLSNPKKSLIKESMKSAEGKRDLTAIQKFQDIVS